MVVGTAGYLCKEEKEPLLSQDTHEDLTLMYHRLNKKAKIIKF